MEYKNQHFVTEAYLKAWCDPHTPNGAFLWVVSKADRTISRKSPRSLFSKTDFHTVFDSSGVRILKLEHRLREIEDKLISLRDNKLQERLPMTPDDRLTIALFASSMFSRVNIQRDEQVEIWKELLDAIESLPVEISSIIKTTADYKYIQVIRDQPMPYHMFHFVNITVPYLFRLNCAVYETSTEPGFITSDNPCFWFDPAIYDFNKPITFFGIGSPTLNIILPISPRQYISLEQNGPDGYIDLSAIENNELEIVDSINQLITANADEFIVINERTYKEKWFDQSNLVS